MCYVDGQCGRVCFPIIHVLAYIEVVCLAECSLYNRTVTRVISTSTTFGLTGLLSMHEEDECSWNEAASEGTDTWKWLRLTSVCLDIAWDVRIMCVRVWVCECVWVCHGFGRVAVARCVCVTCWRSSSPCIISEMCNLELGVLFGGSVSLLLLRSSWCLWLGVFVWPVLRSNSLSHEFYL